MALPENLKALIEDESAQDTAILILRVALARQYAREGDILNWGRICFPKKFSLPFCHELHEYFVSIRGEEFTNTEAPRNHAKTTIKCFLIPIFQALNEPHTFQHYLNVQATGEKAIAVNMAVRDEIEHNEVLRLVYGDQIGEKWNESQFVLKNGVIFTAVGAGQSIRGLNYHNIRPDYLLVDDLYEDEDINNPESTEKKNEWFLSTLYSARAKTRRCSIHLQGTAINGEDLLEKLKKNADWKSRTFRAIVDWETKKILWPELNSFEKLMRDKETMGSVIFMREMQNERRDQASAIIKSDWLKKWEYDPDELFRRFSTHFFVIAVRLTCDPSIGKNLENDYTGIALILKTGYDDGQGTDFWIHALVNQHLSLEARVAMLEGMAKDQPRELTVTEVPIEGIAGFADFVAEVKRRTNLPVKDIGWVKDKISILESKSHYFENGKVHLNKNIDPKLKDLLKHQLTTNYPKHDDLRDGVLLGIDADDSDFSWV